VHWCHQWCTDFLYSPWELRQIKRWLKKYSLAILDIHASAGREKYWASTREWERRAGLELVKNRLDMAARLDCDVIVIHFPRRIPGAIHRGLRRWSQLYRSLDALAPYARQRQVRLAVENSFHDDFVDLRELFTYYSPDYLGLCYDSGHGNIGGAGLEHLETVKDRLLAVHLHDNDGEADWHRLPHLGTVAWPRLTDIITCSAYRKCLNLEVNMANSGYNNERVFLREAFARGMALTSMVKVP
jgi:sugar phosphate isomerase/epimerase